MTFGELKSTIENNFVKSYLNESEFKQTIKDFKNLTNHDKSFSKLFYLYDQLSESKNISKEEANEILNEGVRMIKNILENYKTPKIKINTVNNIYSDIDNLVYENNLNLSEIVQCKKNIINKLMSENKEYNASVKLPFDSMIKVGNQVVIDYLSKLDEDVKRDLVDILCEDTVMLEEKFDTLKKNSLVKLNTLLSTDDNVEMKSALQETINKVDKEEFSKLNYIKLKDLYESL